MTRMQLQRGGVPLEELVDARWKVKSVTIDELRELRKRLEQHDASLERFLARLEGS